MRAVARGPMTRLVTSGWFDLQVNGYGGHDYNSPHVEVRTVVEVARLLAGRGVAHHLPTLITGAPSRLLQAARVIREARAAGWGAQVPGLHLEGPFISPADGPRGAHPVEHCRLPDLSLIEDLQSASGGVVRLVTLAPELPGALDLIVQLRQQGITVAVGHSDADEACLAEAVAAGVQMITHYGNGIRATLPRHPNLLWAALVEQVHLSLILDGHHLPSSVARVAYGMKGASGLSLVSDSVHLAGSPPGRYSTTVGEDVELLPSGRLQLTGTPYLAGSAISLLEAVRHAVVELGWPVHDVLSMVTSSPRALVDVPDESTTTLSITGRQLRIHEVSVGGRTFSGKDLHA